MANTEVFSGRSRSRVYFIQSACEGRFIKIGVATDLVRRLASLQTGSPHKLTLLHDLPGDRAAEIEMHFRFAHLHFSCEWFHPGQDLLRFCKKASGRPRLVHSASSATSPALPHPEPLHV